MKKEIKKPYTKPTFEKRVNITQLTAMNNPVSDSTSTTVTTLTIASG